MLLLVVMSLFWTTSWCLGACFCFLAGRLFLDVWFAFVIGRRWWKYLEETVQATLCWCRPRLQNLFATAANSIFIELAIATQICNQAFFIRIDPFQLKPKESYRHYWNLHSIESLVYKCNVQCTYVNRCRISNFGFHEKLACLFIVPVFWHQVFAFVDIFEDFFNRFVLLNQFNGTFRSNATNGFAVIASEQNTQIDKLKINSFQTNFSNLVLFEIYGRLGHTQ